MLDDLVKGLTKWPHVFRDDAQEQLAWVLGAPAAAFWVVEPQHALPGEEAKRSRVLSLVREAQGRKAGTPIPPQLQTLIENRRRMLRQQRDLCAQRYSKQEESLRETAALLPDAKTLDQIIRYETHIERSLQRNIEQLAKLRGVAVESLSSRMWGRLADGSVVAVEQQRTRSIGPGLAGKKLPNEARGVSCEKSNG